VIRSAIPQLPLVVLALVGTGCAVPPALVRSPYTVIAGDSRTSVSQVPISQEEWTLARKRLAELRADLPSRPYVERVRIGVVDPRSGKLYQGRGAVAISPDRAARLVLVGPGGTTALDVWVTRDRFRFAIPSIDLERTGGADPADAKGLPIGFLRWWFLSPLAGELVVARSNAEEAAFVLRDARATVTIRTDGQRFFALRREGDQLEGLEWVGEGVHPAAGARGTYVDGKWGTRVHVLVEEVLTEEPDPDAFFDPAGNRGRSL
jgi:hypothetical protein